MPPKAPEQSIRCCRSWIWACRKVSRFSTRSALCRLPQGENEPTEKKDKNHYKLDFAIDLKDLKLDLNADGLHKGTLNISLIVYDRYGNVISREDHVADTEHQAGRVCGLPEHRRATPF